MNSFKMKTLNQETELELKGSFGPFPCLERSCSVSSCFPYSGTKNDLTSSQRESFSFPPKSFQGSTSKLLTWLLGSQSLAFFRTCCWDGWDGGGGGGFQVVCAQVWHWALLPPRHAPDVWNGCGHWDHFPASLAGLGVDGQGLYFLVLGPSHFLTGRSGH